MTIDLQAHIMHDFKTVLHAIGLNKCLKKLKNGIMPPDYQNRSIQPSQFLT